MSDYKSRLDAKLRLYIPTRGRIEYQHTLRALPETWRKRTTLVCPKEEAGAHRENWPGVMIHVQPKEIKTIAQKRAWIFREAFRDSYEKIMMLDDDLRFAVRRKTLDLFRGYAHSSSRVRGSGGMWEEYKKRMPGIDALVNCEEQDARLNKIFLSIESMLDVYAHGGIGPRMMNNNFGCQFILNSRAMYAIAFHVPTVIKECKLGRIEHREDFDYTLQLLRKGHENAVLCWAVCEQTRYYNASGGAQEERMVKASNADAYKLAKLHPGIVKAVARDYKQSVPRVEVNVQWAKAAEEGHAYKMGFL